MKEDERVDMYWKPLHKNHENVSKSLFKQLKKHTYVFQGK